MPAIRRDSFYAAQFWRRVDKKGKCWLWTRGQNGHGYGVTHVRLDGQLIRSAHRAAYMLTIGPIPEGLTLDHLCRVRHCVNPDHLEPVTQAENNRRAALARGPARRPRSFKVPDDLWQAALQTARENEEPLSEPIREFLERYARRNYKKNGKRNG